jgi:hypothetical protein
VNRFWLAVLLGLPSLALAADPRVAFYLGETAERKQMLVRCMEITVPQAEADAECRAARTADRQAYRAAAKADRAKTR